jgi:uncharacterized membrane protein YadS
LRRLIGIHADDQDDSYSISTIFLFNVVAVFLFPAVGHFIGLSDNGFGMWAGTAINDTSSVWLPAIPSATRQAFLPHRQTDAQLMIVPITLALAIAYAHMNKSENFSRWPKCSRGLCSVLWQPPVIRSLGFIPTEISASLAWSGKFLIMAAMAAIGLNTILKNSSPPDRVHWRWRNHLPAVMLSSLGIQMLGTCGRNK